MFRISRRAGAQNQEIGPQAARGGQALVEGLVQCDSGSSQVKARQAFGSFSHWNRFTEKAGGISCCRPPVRGGIPRAFSTTISVMVNAWSMLGAFASHFLRHTAAALKENFNATLIYPSTVLSQQELFQTDGGIHILGAFLTSRT